MGPLFIRILKQWLPIAVAFSVLCLIIYAVIQQDIRIGANDPQIQIAEDTAATLDSSMTPTISGKVDVAQSLSPFTIIYNKQGSVIYSNALLNGKIPTLPQGALASSKGTAQPGENRITWQPENGVRLASVIVSYSNGYVLAGRNIREVEIREDQQLQIVFLGWIVGMLASLICVCFVQALFTLKRK